ncbi:bifunctional phosphopantothenoylcysteine decarboxylase/phosphopantothenate--cysteine ligase CoaBC [Kribbella sp. NPDC049174]|uniref:bifunctional phosphopantothenoylcysteine decarboxylase/phosphopantothenate--cysteine ligase CoaBC n=1 Tax=Kribbella sp. NPDC049174 TaxID=3364112 RepID=UPI00371F21C0
MSATGDQTPGATHGPGDSDVPAKARPNVVLGVGGGIAAYKVCDLLRRLTESGHSVRVVPTAAALEFVGAATWAALSGQPVTADPFDNVQEVPHVRIGKAAELVVVAPATANLIAKAAHGLADDLLTNTLLTARCPILFAAAMHTEMWEHPATQANVATLRSRGITVLEPAVGRLTGADTGRGRLPEPSEIFAISQLMLADEAARAAGQSVADLTGKHVLISAGGTREHLDPVRYLGNSSSGKQGYALARIAAARGAKVTLVAANSELPDPAGVQVVPVISTRDLYDEITGRAGDADAIVMAAAPADFRPADVAEHKIKKTSDGSVPAVDLVQNPDILQTISHDRRRSDQVIVGFAAETGDAEHSVLELGRAKLERKGCDLLVVNDVSGGKVFGSDNNEAVILDRDGNALPVPSGSKDALAGVIWNLVATHWH